MNIELIIAIIVLVVGLTLSAIAINFMRSGNYESREQILDNKLKAMQAALDVMNEDRRRDLLERQRDRQKLDELEKENNSLKFELDVAKRQIAELEQKLAKYEGDKKEQDLLLVIHSSDNVGQKDLAALRGVKRVTGMPFRRLLNATMQDIHRVMSEYRLRGKPIKRVLFFTHATKGGVIIDNKAVSGEELSSELQDVKILVLAGCETSAIGQWLSVVDHVITLGEKVLIDDAARFVEAYFTEIGKNIDPEEAFYTAVDLVPAVGEYIEYHSKR